MHGRVGDDDGFVTSFFQEEEQTEMTKKKEGTFPFLPAPLLLDKNAEKEKKKKKTTKGGQQRCPGEGLHLSKEGLAALRTDIARALNDHDVLLAVGLVFKVVVNVRQRRLALDTREASWVESPALIETYTTNDGNILDASLH